MPAARAAREFCAVFIAFRRRMVYNKGMNIVKTAGGARPQEKQAFAFSEKTVQGAKVGKRGEDMYIESPRRFNLYTDAKERVEVLEGGGYIKWKRGEIPFSAGDAFDVDAPGEYELNGACAFAVLRGQKS